MQPEAVSVRTSALALLGASALCLGVLAKGAGGYVIKGSTWPGGVVRYYNAAPDQRSAVQRAVDAWNSSGAKVRFVAVPAAQAQLRIEHFPKVPCTINAEATVGYAPRARVWVFQRDQSSPYCNSYMAVQTIAHELGHVLGLGHETRGCSRMNPVSTVQGPTQCPVEAYWRWRCQLLTPDDVAGAVALYGGRARPPRGPENCDLYPAISPPSGLRVAWTGAPQQVRVSFRRRPSATVPAFLSVQEYDPESYVAVATPNRCETEPRAHHRTVWQARPGETQSTVMTLAKGTYCLTVWAVDSFARPSARAATLWVRI
jgi:hypothetical protein